MKQTLLFFAFLLPVLASQAQFQISTVNVTTNDLVYDANTNRIYVSIPSSNGSNGNSIGIINPVTNTLLNTVFMGSEPSVLAISDNGQYIYSGFNASGTVRRFNVANQTADIQFSLGSDPSTGTFLVEDIEVMPGAPTTIAISRKNIGFSPRHEGVAIYDNDVMRSATTQDHTGSNKIEFKDASSLFGYNNESTEYGLRRLAVNAGGVSQVSVTNNILTNFGIDFIYYNNFIYATDGKVINVLSTPFVAGQFSNINGPAVFDEALNRVCYASSSSSGVIAFKMFNPDTFLIDYNVPITQAFGTSKSIVTCGTGCWAFNTTDNKVVIIKNPSLKVDKFDDAQSFEVYPNPTNGKIFIKNIQGVMEAQVYDMQGRKVNNVALIENTLNLEAVNSGMYLLKIIDWNGNTVHKKIVKK